MRFVDVYVHGIRRCLRRRLFGLWDRPLVVQRHFAKNAIDAPVLAELRKLGDADSAGRWDAGTLGAGLLNAEMPDAGRCAPGAEEVAEGAPTSLVVSRRARVCSPAIWWKAGRFDRTRRGFFGGDVSDHQLFL